MMFEIFMTILMFAGLVISGAWMTDWTPFGDPPAL